MLIRKIMMCSGLTLCALAMHTASAQNYRGDGPTLASGDTVVVCRRCRMACRRCQWERPGCRMACRRCHRVRPKCHRACRRCLRLRPIQQYGPGGFRRGTAGCALPRPVGGHVNALCVRIPESTVQTGMSGMSGMSGMQGQQGLTGAVRPIPWALLTRASRRGGYFSPSR